MSKTVTVKFLNFWPDMNPDDNRFTNALRTKFDVVALDSDGNEVPDILFYAPTGHKTHHRYDCLKVYWSGENDVPDFNQFDYAISHRNIEIDGRHLRYPLYLLYDEWARIGHPDSIDSDRAVGRDFCTAVIRNSNFCDEKRIRIIDAVESYRPVAYGGLFRNNVGGCVADKIDFIRKYKFNLALENSRVPGYVTEKIMEAFVARTVPIYWGAPDVVRDFNPAAFVNVSDYESTDSFVAALRRIDNDPDEYLSLLSAPPVISGNAVDYDAVLTEFLCGIASSMRRHTESKGYSGMLMRRASRWETLMGNDRLGAIAGRMGNLIEKIRRR
jgi:hypothetical protein